MARTVQDTRLADRAARSRLAPRGKPYFRELIPGEHIGYRKLDRGRAGSWIHRWAVTGGKTPYKEEGIGTADDILDADGVAVLNFTQAQTIIQTRIAERSRQQTVVADTYLVKHAVADHVAAMIAEGASVENVTKFVCMWPELDEVPLVKLTTEQLRAWMTRVAQTPRRVRTPKGQPQRYAATRMNDSETVRKRRATVNRYRAVLFAALNRAHHEKQFSDSAWRYVKPFKKTSAARPGFFTVEEVKQLLAVCPPDFRDLAFAAVCTGARYGSLAEVRGRDFNPQARTLEFRKTKAATYVAPLGDEAVEFFKSLCARRGRDELLLVRADGSPWVKDSQTKIMEKACWEARLEPIGFHQFRHTFASLALMNGMSVDLAAKCLGCSPEMVRNHYGHLVDDFITRETRRTLPTYGLQIKPPLKVVA